MNRSDEKARYFILKPDNQTTVRPLITIKPAVPKSGCDNTKETGTNSATKGSKEYFILLTCLDGSLL